MSTRNPVETLVEDRTPAPLSPSSSLITFDFVKVQPPSILYVDVDDQLVIAAATSQTSEVVTVNVRLLEPDGRLQDMQFTLRPLNARQVVTGRFGLAQGYILSISTACTVAITRGATFCRIGLQRSASGVGQPAQMMFADYVTTQATSAYPNGRIMSPLEGPGLLYGVSQANPAAGADFSVSVPVNARWKVRSLSAQFNTSAVVANRQVLIAVADLTNVKFRGFPLQNIPASTAALISAYAGTPFVSVFATGFTIPLPPDLYLTGAPATSDVIGSGTTGKDAGDQWSQIRLLVEEWLDNV